MGSFCRNCFTENRHRVCIEGKQRFGGFSRHLKSKKFLWNNQGNRIYDQEIDYFCNEHYEYRNVGIGVVF
jgi:hypothetical protein